jgi:endonuclease/exonuclease/phosphatase (EEP) superfamily protein YafD
MSAHRFRILSANLWNGAAHPAAFAELVTALRPDAVATQELAPEQADALAQVLPFGHLDPMRDYCGMGIALRAPARVYRLPLGFRDACVADVHWQNGTAQLAFELINVHVQAPHGGPTWRSMARRRRQLRSLLRHITASPHRPRVLIGDLNATPLWLVYRRLTAHLADAARIAAARHGRPIQRTWGPSPSAPRLLRIDHALVHGVAVEDFQVVRVPGSDHSAIIVDLVPPVAALPGPAHALEQRAVTPG